MHSAQLDILLTGLPRSGSAVVGALIDYLPDSVYLNQPEWQFGIARKLNGPMPFSKWLMGDFFIQRKLLLNETPVSDLRAADNSPLFDGISAENNPQLRHFTRPGLSDDFTLCMRQHTLYSAILPEILKFAYYRIIVVIRHPLDIMLSWTKHPKVVPAPGQPHGLLTLWPEAHTIAESKADEYDRMAQLIELFFARYHELKDYIEIIKYEDIIENPEIVSGLFGHDRLPANISQLMPRPQTRMHNDLDEMRAALKRYAVCARECYPDI